MIKLYFNSMQDAHSFAYFSNWRNLDICTNYAGRIYVWLNVKRDDDIIEEYWNFVSRIYNEEQVNNLGAS